MRTLPRVRRSRVQRVVMKELPNTCGRHGHMNSLTPNPHPGRRRIGIAALTLLVVVLAGCSTIVGPRSFAMSTVSTSGETWSVNVNDRSGHVTNVSVDPTPLFIDAAGLPFNPPGSQDLVVIPWVGGLCDRVTTFSVASRDGGGLVITYHTEVTPGTCDLIGISHQLVLTTSSAISAGRVTVTRDP